MLNFFLSKGSDFIEIKIQLEILSVLFNTGSEIKLKLIEVWKLIGIKIIISNIFR